MIRNRYVKFCCRINDYAAVEYIFVLTVLPCRKIIYIIFDFFAWQVMHHDYCLLWALPTPDLWNRIGNFWQYYKCRRNRQRAGMRGLKELPHSCFSFFLQISSKPFSVKDYQLIQYLIPVPVSLRPLFDYVLAGKIQHLFQCCIAWKYTLGFCDFQVLTVQSLYDVTANVIVTSIKRLLHIR